MAVVMLAVWLTAARGAAAGCAETLFQPPVRYAAAADEVVLLADLDADGRPEILTSGNHVDQLGAFSLLANRGDGTFAGERSVAAAFGDRLEGAGDLDGDGVPDLLASGYWANGIATYRGSGASQFEARVAYDTATHGGPSLLVDYDGDGLTDVVSLSFGSGNPVRVHLFRGRGDGTFEGKKTFETSLTVAASPSTRIRDGVVEILAGSHSGHLALLRLVPGNVSVSLLEAGPGTDLTSLFADVDGDGIADIVETNDGESGTAGDPFEWIFITLGKPDGTFHERKQLARPRKMAFPATLRAGDFDGDGRLDLVAGDFRAATLHFFRGDGAGSFEEGVALDAGGPVNDLAVADLNGDGRLDLVTANEDRSVSVILNRGRCPAPRRRAVRH